MAEHCPQPERDCPFDQIEWGRMMQKLETIHEAVGGINTRLDRQNGRIGKLENWRWWIMGGFGAVLVVLKLLKVGI